VPGDRNCWSVPAPARLVNSSSVTHNKR